MDDERKDTPEEGQEQDEATMAAHGHFAANMLDEILKKEEIEPLSSYARGAIDVMSKAEDEGRHDPGPECELLEEIAKEAEALENAVAELSIPMSVTALNAALRDLFESVLQIKRIVAMATADLTACSIDDARLTVLVDSLAAIGTHSGAMMAEQAKSAMSDVYIEARTKLRDSHALRVAEYEELLEECGGDQMAVKKQIIMKSLRKLMDRMREAEEAAAEAEEAAAEDAEDGEDTPEQPEGTDEPQGQPEGAEEPPQQQPEAAGTPGA